MKTVKVGKAALKLVRLRKLVDLYVEYLEKDPYSMVLFRLGVRVCLRTRLDSLSTTMAGSARAL